MSAVVAALIGAVGIWLLLAVLTLLIWVATDHPWVFGSLLVTAFGAVVGLAVYGGAMGWLPEVGRAYFHAHERGF